jgi:hypothetical protein
MENVTMIEERKKGHFIGATRIIYTLSIAKETDKERTGKKEKILKKPIRSCCQ